MLREQIALIIQENISDPNGAAIAIIDYLDDQGLSLEGNGWLDDDPHYSQDEDEEDEDDD